MTRLQIFIFVEWIANGGKAFGKCINYYKSVKSMSNVFSLISVGFSVSDTL